MVSNGGSVDMLFEIMQLQKTVGGERCEESWLAHGSRKSESLDATWHHSVRSGSGSGFSPVTSGPSMGAYT